MGRNRKKAYQKLPKYVYVNRGRYIYRPPGERDIVLGKVTSLDLPGVWESYKVLTGESDQTLDYLIRHYYESTQFNNLKSKRDVKRLLDNLLNTDAKGRFGSKQYQNITPGVIRKYLDYKNSVTANREISALSAAWSYCYERDIVRIANPCKGVRRIPESPRERYITDAEFKAVYEIAPDHYKVAMELAYLCRMRRNEVLDTRYRDVEREGLNTRRIKGSDSALTLWTPRLKAAVELGLKGKMRVPDMPLVGMGIKGDTFTQGFRKLVGRADVEWFVFHDIKAKGISDFTGDKKKAGGHKSEKMVDVYDRKRIIVEATE